MSLIVIISFTWIFSNSQCSNNQSRFLDLNELPPAFLSSSCTFSTKTHRRKGEELIQKSVVLLCSLASMRRRCERAARHHTGAALKIHVYHCSSLIDDLSSLYVYEVRGLPVASNGDPEDLPRCPRSSLLLLIETPSRTYQQAEYKGH